MERDTTHVEQHGDGDVNVEQPPANDGADINSDSEQSEQQG